MEIVFASTKRVKYGKSKLKSPFVIWKMRLQRPQSYCILIAKWLFLRNRDDSIGKEEELLSLQTKNLEMHSTSLVQSTKVLNKISEAEKQYNEQYKKYNREKNETEFYFNSIQSISNWTNSKIETLSTLNQLIQSSLSSSQALLRYALKVILIFLITSLPGVFSFSFCIFPS